MHQRSFVLKWQPGSNQKSRHARDQLYRQLRAFFQARQFIEVDPPLLGRGGSTDPHLHSLTTRIDGQAYYLQTSPEFFMKRLLAAGSGPIYALTKSFRAGEQGRYHNTEFTILEWYQPGFDDHALMAQVGELVETVLDLSTEKFSYRDCFLQATGLSPHSANVADLSAFAEGNLNVSWTGDDSETDRDMWLDLIFSHCVQPALLKPTLVYDYPASQAALAQTGVNDHGEAIARRFELFYQGVELGNGYSELCDGYEQQRRFEADNERRVQAGLDSIRADEKLVAALKSGMPACAGIAIGVDRLLMVKLGVQEIDDAMDFSRSRL